MPVVLFVTIAIRSRVNALANDLFHNAFLTTLDEADAWRVFLYVIMPDHVHLYVVPRTHPPVAIQTWVKFLKRKLTPKLPPQNAWRWQYGCWDTQIRSREHLDEKASYVRMNPVRAGLYATPDEWKWRGQGEWVI